MSMKKLLEEVEKWRAAKSEDRSFIVLLYDDHTGEQANKIGGKFSTTITNMAKAIDRCKSLENIIIESAGIVGRKICFQKPRTKHVIIRNEAELYRNIADYKERYPETYTSLEEIKDRLSHIADAWNEVFYNENEIQIDVCSDWQDKVFCFKISEIDDESHFISFNFIGIFKG